MTATLAHSEVQKLASKVEADIRHRGLRPGDRYLTSDEVRRIFNVDKRLLNKAMQELAQREVVTRRRKAGTFVGSAFQPAKSATKRMLDDVHVMMAMDYFRTGVLTPEVFARGFHASLPGTDLHIHYIAEQDPLGAVRKIVEQARDSGGREGFVLIRCPQEVQQYMADQPGLSAVVFGTTYPGMARLCSLDTDMAGAGMLMTRYLLARQCQKLVLVLRHHWRPGDNLVLDGVMRELGNAKVDTGNLTIRSLPPIEAQVEHELEHVLTQEPQQATGVMCIGDFYARIADRVIQSKQLNVQLITGVRSMQPWDNGSRIASVNAVMDGLDQVKAVGGMLRQLADANETMPESIRVPVELKDATNGPAEGCV